MKRVLWSFAAAALVLSLAAPGSGDGGKHDGKRRVTRLPATGQWFEHREFDRSGSPLDRSVPPGDGTAALYLADLQPGKDYTLGLRYQTHAGRDPSVEIFDRWPSDLKARRYRLPMGPVVRTDPRWTEYRWRLGVSPRSRGGTAFVAVRDASGSTPGSRRFPYFMYLVTPAVRPVNRFGSGITYLQGPSDLMLPEYQGSAGYVIVSPFGEEGSFEDPGGNAARGGELISNGDFKHGFDGWEMFSDMPNVPEDHLALGSDGLRIWSGNRPVVSGVRQTVQRDVGDSGSLTLEAVLRIDEDAKQYAPSGDAAVELSVCYLDALGMDHCGGDSYRASFTTHRMPRNGGSPTRITAGEWFSFEDELMDLDPRPQVIKSVTLAGGKSPGQTAWIKEVHLTQRGDLR